MEVYASSFTTSGRSKDKSKAIETLKISATSDGEFYKVGLLWNDNPRYLPNNFFSATSQLKSLEGTKFDDRRSQT